MEKILKKITFALLKGTVSTQKIKESIKQITIFDMTYNGETINTVPLIMPYINLKNGLTQKQIEPIIKKYTPNHAIFHFIGFLEKYNIKEKYLKNTNITENDLIPMLLNKPPIDYLDTVFRWKSTIEGYEYWERKCTLWLIHINKLRQTLPFCTIKQTRNYSLDSPLQPFNFF